MPTWAGAETCTLTVWRHFRVDGDTIGFTLGRIPEGCSEFPRMIWTTRDHRSWRHEISPLYNWNVEALWCTPRYLVMGLESDYEVLSGETTCPHDERLAFWNVETGRVLLSGGTTCDEGSPAQKRSVYLPEDFPGWRRAEVAEGDGALILSKGDTTLAYWPENGEYALSYRPRR